MNNKNFTFIFTNAKIISFATYSDNLYDEDLYHTITDEFNNFSRENNLDIELDLVLFSNKNVSSKNEYISIIESNLRKISNSFDLVAFDSVYSKLFSSNLLNIEGKLFNDTNHINMYFSNETYSLCTYSNQWFGLPLFLNYKVLYSNKNFLKNYNEEIPETWDELIIIAKKILEKENNNLIGYNDNENAVFSLFEYIYSFRDNTTSPFPEITDKIVVNALQKLIHIKNEISTADERYNEVLLDSKSIIFSNSWSNYKNDDYFVSKLPGKTKGISGSSYSELIIGISKKNSSDNINAALRVLEFFTSENVQKEIIIKKYKLFSAIKNIYSDEEICLIIDCELIKSIQSVTEPIYLIQNYNNYSKKVTKLLYNFFSGSTTADKLLTDIDDITRIYYYSLNIPIGLIMFIISLIIFFIVIGSIIALFIERFKKYFKFLSLDLWIIYSLASLLYISSEMIYFWELTPLKCEISHAIMIMGSCLYFIPILHKLITNFPRKTRFSEYIKYHKYLYITIIISFQGILNIILLILSSYTVMNVMVENDKNFGLCMTFHPLANAIAQIQVLFNLLLYSCSCILVFFEWNITETYKDIRALTVILCVDGITQFLLTVVVFTNIRNYIVYYTLHIGINLLYVIMNHIYMFVIRIWIENKNKKANEEEVFIKELVKFNSPTTYIINSSSIQTSDSCPSNNSKAKSINNRSIGLLDLHFAKAQNE
ncbi:periplasmic binding protein-like II [Neocallimastix californiae]|uniref:Periplasmic binding protein-like II n=1 Tax=Neocallimastix californiae TaxID=1754190 RepID=A0A1Y2AU37_9FUNG|nr:periplasmic binding protein-like II [Neocallimastix californiae]|eukprot:ORY26108.1 periplasmic binding protein-like II [Neocallimastix californiae]